MPSYQVTHIFFLLDVMMAFDERAFCDVYIHQCVCSKIEGECKEILSKNRHQHKSLPFQIPDLGSKS